MPVDCDSEDFVSQLFLVQPAVPIVPSLCIPTFCAFQDIGNLCGKTSESFRPIVMHIGRPGIADKMFDHAVDHGLTPVDVNFCIFPGVLDVSES